MTNRSTKTHLAPVHVHAIGVVGVLALAGIGYALGYAPSARAQHQADLQRQAITRATDEASATAQHIQTARLGLESLRAAVGTPPAHADLMDTLADAAVAHSLVAHNILADGTVAVDGLTRTTAVVHTSGSFSDIVGFIADLGRVHPGAAIDGFSIMPDPMGADALVFQASLSVYAPQTAPSHAATMESAGHAPAAASPVR